MSHWAQRCRLALLAAVVLTSTSGAAGSEMHSESAGQALVDGARIVGADAEPHNWLSHGRTYDEQRFSPLAQIQRDNVARLGLAWALPTGTLRGLEATPLVADGVMFLTLTWSVVVALDAATGRELWRHDPEVPGHTARNACCDVVNRGVALWKGRVYVGTLDGRLLALDARSGTPLWSVRTADPDRGYTITGAPRVVKGRVIIGNGGGELGVRGYVSAYDAEDGSLKWRFYTVPAGPDPPHEHPALELAAATWSRDSQWETGLGGTVWDSIAFDPELDLLYVGVGNSSNYNREQRSPGGGDNLFLASILALDPDDGRLVWHYQTTPGEHWDYTATQQMILAELEIEGRRRSVLMQAPKNGFFYVLDRESGELLSARNYVPTSWASHVDPATGRPVETDGSWSETGRQVTPGPPGGHNWHPMSFSPRTGLVYLPVTHISYPYFPDPSFRFELGRWNTGEDLPALLRFMESVPDLRFCEPTELVAWDPVAARAVWRVAHDFFTPAGVLATGGDLVFQASNRTFSAYAADTGERLWSSQTPAGIVAPPISYAVDGVQYVAVLAGLGGGNLVVIPVDAVNAGHLLVYRLDGEATMPPARARTPGEVDLPPFPRTPAQVERGRELYADYCMFCHGFEVRNGGMMPDLRHSKRAVHEQWHDIVLGGTRQAKGMASFADLLDAEEVDAIHAYVVERALHESSWLERAADWLAARVCVPAHWLTY